MAQDPYGFTPAAAGSSAPAGPASLAMWLGVGSAMLTSVGFCFCYIPYFLALPMGVAAVWYGSQASGARAPTDDAGRSMAMAGMVSGLLSAIVSGMFLLFILFYLLMYLGIGAAALVLGATQG